jgi:dTDP-4-dehydrorhamnose 3,5-epimerase (EC 5.1.3.13)
LPSTCKRLAAEGLLLLQPRRFADSRGYFVETYSQRDVAAFGIGAEFVQDNEAFSSVRGTLRGLHLQTAPEPQAKLVRVIAGAIFDVAVDVRQNSPTYGKW